MALAVATGIAPSVWAEEGMRAIATAQELLEEAHGRIRAGRDDDRQMSG